MINTDILLNDFLDFLSKCNSGEQPDPNQYFQNKRYYPMWEHFIDLVYKGICPPSMQVSLEYEKLKLLKNECSDDELFEIVLLEKLLYSFYNYDFIQLAELIQNFASQRLCTKYEDAIQKLWKSGEQSHDVRTENSCEFYLVTENSD